jgi:hypothetical protein
MGQIVGIDLGTSNTVVAHVPPGPDGRPRPIADENGSVLIPSVVSMHPSGKVLVATPDPSSPTEADRRGARAPAHAAPAADAAAGDADAGGASLQRRRSVAEFEACRDGLDRPRIADPEGEKTPEVQALRTKIRHAMESKQAPPDRSVSD